MEPDTLDQLVLAKQRKEQRIFRDLLVDGRQVAPCTICGRDLPIELLVAAHIKQRSKCIGDSFSDRCNLNNITLMCSLRCDSLFELRMIRVIDGVVQPGDIEWKTDDLTEAILSVVGNPVRNWEAAAEFYSFGW